MKQYIGGNGDENLYKKYKKLFYASFTTLHTKLLFIKYRTNNAILGEDHYFYHNDDL